MIGGENGKKWADSVDLAFVCISDYFQQVTSCMVLMHF